ncbi:uncharacterized protein LOC110991610 isoform X2 [Pieris rapae]|uniref:uncharacterized protein LOC110991610 isoform X2 n=1 Tax=Pieris rapae TaxID=64459 RepID=UPI001E27A33B|nr:uncharacterized protein LOC110991610 isoform X2 [Pieris rapae]
MSKVNKENFRLLDLSSDEDSEDLQLEIIPNRKKKMSRKERNRVVQPRVVETSLGNEVHCVLCWATRGTLVLWLLMLTWICASLYDQVTTMKVDIAKVSTIGGNVNDDLQLCHTSFKELKKNASALQERLEKLEMAHQALTIQMNKTASELMSVSEQLSAAPKLVDTPRRIAELQRTVADFGSQIKGFDSSISSAHKQALTATSGVEELKSYLVHLEERTNDTIANVSENVKLDESLKEQIAVLNTTLMSRLDGLQSIIDEINKPKEVSAIPMAPPSAVPGLTSTTTIAGPVKPRVLEMKEPASS